jgi:hypothetical protein
MPHLSRRLSWRPFRRPLPSVAAWASTVPPGTKATAAALYPRFMASRPGPLPRSTWSWLILGRELARLMQPGIVHRGPVWTFAARPAGVGLPWR